MDTEYALRLAEYISEYKTREYKVYVFSEDIKFYEFIGEEKPDILLIEKQSVDTLREKVDAWSIKKVYVLCEDKAEENDKEGYVYKYQTVESIISHIEKGMWEEGEQKSQREKVTESEKDGDFKIIVLIAGAFPLDACNIALGINHHYKNSYILMDFNRISILSESKDEKKMSECIYILESNVMGEVEFEQCINYRNGTAYISGINDGFDVSYLSKDGLEKLMKWGEVLGYKGVIMICDTERGIYVSKLVDKKDIVVLEGSGKRVRDYTYNLIKEMGCVGDKAVRLINTDSIRESQLNQVVDYSGEGYKKGGLYKLINEICRV